MHLVNITGWQLAKPGRLRHRLGWGTGWGWSGPTPAKPAPGERVWQVTFAISNPPETRYT